MTSTSHFIFDAHLDLSMNAMEWNRDLTRPIEEIRRRESGKTDMKDRGNGVVCFPEMRRGRIGICVATQIARYVKESNPFPGWHSPEIAWAMTQAQLAWYRAMEEKGEMRQIRTATELKAMATLWMNDPPADAPIGYILSLEGADSMITLGHLERSYADGLRALGPAHYGVGTYSPGTEAEGPLTAKGRELVKQMDRLGIIMDATHLTDEAFWEAVELFQGPVWASHQNCRTLVPAQRQFTDEQLKHLIERGGVIGAALDAWMMVPGWIKFKTRPEDTGVNLQHMVDHIDHVCQLAGNSLHSGIGTDLDGGFGREQAPMDLETIADLQKVPPMLAARGYSEEDIANIMHGNFLRFLEKNLPG
ncbi:MAG TPA: membrane dipeptidase [Verrucomicrobium sp.]|nr:membrane dipeptidase [Verrucomicrobium sp.]